MRNFDAENFSNEMSDNAIAADTSKQRFANPALSDSKVDPAGTGISGVTLA